VAEAARKIIVEQGPEKLTTEAIGIAVGLSDGGIFRHFKNLEEIVIQVLEDNEASFVRMSADLRDSPGFALDKLERLFRLELSSAERRGAVGFVILSWSLHTGNPVLKQRARKTAEMHFRVVIDFLREGQSEGLVAPGMNVERAAELFLGMLQGHIRWWTLQDRTEALCDACDDLWALYRRAVQTAPTFG